MEVCIYRLQALGLSPCICGKAQKQQEYSTMFRITWYLDEELLRAYLEYLYEPVCKMILNQRMWCVLPAALDFHRITHCKETPPISKCLSCVYTHVHVDVLFQLHYLHLT